jgi:hypothetical protein
MANLNITGSVVALVPTAEIPAFITALMASAPSDVASPAATISITLPSAVTGDGNITGSVSASMSQDDLGKFVAALVAAVPADAAIQSGSLTFLLPAPAPAAS